MGGCASRPKDLHVAPEAVPEEKEAPDSPVKVEPEAVAQDNKEAPPAEMAEAKPEDNEEAEINTVTEDKAVVIEDKATVTEEKKEAAATTEKPEEADRKEGAK